MKTVRRYPMLTLLPVPMPVPMPVPVPRKEPESEQESTLTAQAAEVQVLTKMLSLGPAQLRQGYRQEQRLPLRQDCLERLARF